MCLHHAWNPKELLITFGGEGYALVEYKTLAEARQAIREGHETEFLEKTISVSWAFKPGPENSSS